MGTERHGLRIHWNLRVRKGDMREPFKWCYDYENCKYWVEAGYKPLSGEYLEPHYKQTMRFFQTKHGHRVDGSGALFPYELMNIFSIPRR